MTWDRRTALHCLDQAAGYAAIGGAIVAVFTLFIRLLTHFPFYDETTHVRHLWLISNGFRPGPDFFSSYPVLAYLPVVPFFRLLPESAFVLLVLRTLSVALFLLAGFLFLCHARRQTRDWIAGLAPAVLLAASVNIGPFLVEYSIDPWAAAAGVGAMALFFRAPSWSTVAAGSALSLLSVAITPKYAMPLFFGLLGHVLADCVRNRRAVATIAAMTAGAAATVLVVALSYRWHNVPIVENLVSSHLMNSKLSLAQDETLLASSVARQFARNPILGAVVFLGIAGWAFDWRKRGGVAFLGAAGILFGAILFCFTLRQDLEQYQTPVYMSLALFAPFAFTLPGNGIASGLLRGALAAAVLVHAAFQVPTAAREFGAAAINRRDATSPHALSGPPAVNELADLNGLLKAIPRNERVVALWPHHPLFRKDLTAIVGDDRPSLSRFLAPDDPMTRIFDPAYFRDALEKNPPALVDTEALKFNYPPGWYQVAYDFLVRHESRYVRVPSNVLPGYAIYIRRDLAPRIE